MGEGDHQKQMLHQGPCMVVDLQQDHKNNHKQYSKHGEDQEDQWMMIMEDDHHFTCIKNNNNNNNNNNIPSSTSSFEDTSSSSNGSLSTSISSSSNLVDEDDDDDASSSSSTSSSSHSPSSSKSNGPLYELSELMSQLPIKRGLSKYFQGKSQSFTCLSRVMSIEDLAKKETPYRKKMMKSNCKSYGGGLDAYKSYNLLPKATIAKKQVSRASSTSFSSFSTGNRSKSTFLGSSTRPPPVPVQKHFSPV
ncbi:hypothetical protein Ddye_014447 [Dipteronia dyeriana]|uniref:Oxidative stress 3 n=1 Tax=Dipteronia dyeriana TaxID=168575 RepID=A0AAD9X8D6_9ROSI|nr:hypothetical protein Ddye_014447 [Dipteronia dyeriana]